MREHDGAPPSTTESYEEEIRRIRGGFKTEAVMRALDSIKLASIVMKNAVELKATAVDLFRSGAYSQSHASDYYLLKVIPAEGSAYTVINDDEMEAFSGECFLADVAVKITEKGVEFENSQTGEKLVVDGFDFEVGLGDVRESQRAV